MNTRNYKIEAIIIKRKNFNEADRLITVFSREKGKLKLIAKGIRKTLSKKAGHLNLMSRVALIVAKGRNLDIITSAQCLRNCENKKLDQISDFFFISELLDKFTVENDSHPEIFDLSEEILSSKPNDLAIDYFKINFLSAIGFKPELIKCVECGNDVDGQKIGFDIENGGVVCSSCVSNNIINNDIIKLMRLMISKDWAWVSRIKANKKILSEEKNLLDNILTHKVELALKSKRFSEEVTALNGEK